ncbi:MAG: alpha/beta hydrolase [Oscillospiraceae bacterium]|nr:alpha/beta hydrolase [Oscillospiraceae bacterium]
MPVKEGKIAIPGAELDYITFGRGEKNLVMIQGLNTRGIRGSGCGLMLMYRMFSKEYRVWLFDRRPDIPKGFTIREMAADTAAAMDALGIRGADIFAVSQGGMIAQHLAADRPDLARRMILAVTSCRTTPAIRETVGGWITMARRGEMKALVADMAEKMYSDAYLKRYRPLLPLLTLLQKPKDVRRFTMLAESCLHFDATADLEKIRCPVLVIGGGEDKVIGSGGAEELAEELGCELYLYDRLGHAAYEEARDFNRRVLDFLRGK